MALLFDGSGAVVGINAQIYSQSGGYQGLSFAIPDQCRAQDQDQIVATGKAQHAAGRDDQDLNQALAQSFGWSAGRRSGGNVAPGSAA